MIRRGLLVAALACVVLAVVGWTRAPATVASEGPDGAAVFQAKGCATCHTGPDSHARIGGFPDLRAAASWDGRGAAGQSARAYVRQSIEEPWAVISPAFTPGGGPTGAMPKLDVSPAEVRALVDYLTGK